MTDVFISYKREERDAARRLAEALQGAGFAVWWDNDILPGEQYRAVTLEILQSCSAAIVIWSAKSIQSSWVLDEAQRALDRGVLIPVRLEELAVYPLGFGQIQAHDLTAWDGRADHPAFRPVITAVERLAGARRPGEKAPASAADVETEVGFWRGVRDTSDVRDVDEYLRRYPDGLFSELARRRAGELRAASSPTPVEPKPVAPDSQPRPFVSPLPQTEQALAPWGFAEFAFVTLATLISGLIAWPIANRALGLQNVFFEEDYALLLGSDTAQNMFVATPLLVFAAWGYDRGKTWWATQGRSPAMIQFGALAVLIVFFLASLGMREHSGRETQLALWLLFVWGAASYARAVAPLLRDAWTRFNPFKGSGS
jgi:hypothetical protein